jgi:hypothetical protein
VVERRDRAAPARRAPTRDLSLREHVERYLVVHTCAPRAKAKLREDLGFPERAPAKPRKRSYKTAAEVDLVARRSTGYPHGSTPGCCSSPMSTAASAVRRGT